MSERLALRVWKWLNLYGAIGPDTERGRKFGAFGRRSIIMFPQTAWWLLPRRRSALRPARTPCRRSRQRNAPQSLAINRKFCLPPARRDFTRWILRGQAARADSLQLCKGATGLGRTRCTRTRRFPVPRFSLHGRHEPSNSGHPRAGVWRPSRCTPSAGQLFQAFGGLSAGSPGCAPVAQLDRASDYGSEG